MPLTLSTWGHAPAGVDVAAARASPRGPVAALHRIEDSSSLCTFSGGGVTASGRLPAVPLGAAVASTVAAARAAPGQGSAPRLLDYFVAFGGELLPDEAGRRPPTADLIFIDATNGASVIRPAMPDVGWPEPRKFAAAATVYRAGGFSVFDEPEQVDTRKLGGKLRSVVPGAMTATAVSAAAPVAVQAAAGAGAAGLPPTRKGSAGAARDAKAEPAESSVSSISRLPPASVVDDSVAAERAFAAAATGACVVVFGGIDAAGRLLDDVLLLNVEAALDSPTPPPPPGSAPVQTSVGSLSASSSKCVCCFGAVPGKERPCLTRPPAHPRRCAAAVLCCRPRDASGG